MILKYKHIIYISLASVLFGFFTTVTFNATVGGVAALSLYLNGIIIALLLDRKLIVLEE